MANIEQKVENLLKPKIGEIGYELYDVEYVKEGKNYFLRIYIDNEKGIDLNDCEKVNDAIMEPLDKADYIKEQYFLEVSSPGVERTLRKDEHLEKNIGKEIYIKLFQKDNDGKKEYKGTLKKYTETEIIIETKETTKKETSKKNKKETNKNNNPKEQESNITEITLERKNIAQIKTVYNWD